MSGLYPWAARCDGLTYSIGQRPKNMSAIPGKQLGTVLYILPQTERLLKGISVKPHPDDPEKQIEIKEWAYHKTVRVVCEQGRIDLPLDRTALLLHQDIPPALVEDSGPKVVPATPGQVLDLQKGKAP